MKNFVKKNNKYGVCKEWFYKFISTYDTKKNAIKVYTVYANGF